MDFAQIGAGIVVVLLALYVIDAIRRPGRGNPPVERYDTEHPHPLARACGPRAPRARASRAPRGGAGRENVQVAPLLRQHAIPRSFRVVYGRATLQGDARLRWHARCTSSLPESPRAGRS
ncbi:MAG TPA: hypothetical protein VII72_19510 [Myxococcota bacterium]